METIITVDNLKCGGCASSIEETLLQIKGIDKVEVQIENGRVIITHQTAIDLPSIKAKLKKLGYPETGTAHGIEKLSTNAKSYVSCALGRMYKNKKAK